MVLHGDVAVVCRPMPRAVYGDLAWRQPLTLELCGADELAGAPLCLVAAAAHAGPVHAVGAASDPR